MRRVRAFVVVLSILPVVPVMPALAQQAPADSPRLAPDVTDSFRGISALFASRLVQAFDSIPEAKYGFAPTPAQQTVGYVAQHLVDANYALCERFGAVARPESAINGVADTVKAKWPKDTLVKQLRQSFIFCTSAFSAVNDAGLGDDLPVRGAPGVTQQRARSLLLFVTDLAEHYAQVASYMRILGMTPPSARSAVAHTAIELPVAVLARYVGTYEVPPSRQFGSPALQLEIFVRDGALLVKPAGQPEGRLWPASERDFFLTVSNVTVSFTRDAAGVTTGLVLHDNGEERIGRKVR